MMSKEDTGGSAFPIPELTNRNGDIYQHAESGMTLRDYFAAKAMQGFIANPDTENLLADDIGTWAYQIADSMLKAREA